MRGLARWLAGHLASRPKGVLLRLGFDDAFPDRHRRGDCDCIDDLCLDLALAVLVARLVGWTFLIASMAVFYWAAEYSLAIWVVAASVLVLVLSVLVLLAAYELIKDDSWLSKAIGPCFGVVAPFFSLLAKLLGVIAKKLFSSWYRTLMAVDRRGIRWALAAAGLLLLVAGTTLQVLALFAPE